MQRCIKVKNIIDDAFCELQDKTLQFITMLQMFIRLVYHLKVRLKVYYPQYHSKPQDPYYKFFINVTYFNLERSIKNISKM